MSLMYYFRLASFFSTWPIIREQSRTRWQVAIYFLNSWTLLNYTNGFSIYFQLPELLEHLPVAGAIKHGPTYCYRLWKGLLDQWMSTDGTVYVITPLLDSKRLADILLLLVKHKVIHLRLRFGRATCIYPDRNAVSMQYTLDAHLTDSAEYTTSTLQLRWSTALTLFWTQ